MNRTRERGNPLRYVQCLASHNMCMYHARNSEWLIEHKEIASKTSGNQVELSATRKIVIIIRHGEAGNNQQQAQFGHQFCDVRERIENR